MSTLNQIQIEDELYDIEDTYARNRLGEIVISHITNKSVSKTCDVLYEDGDDFVEKFNLAYNKATSLGIKTIKLLKGNYVCKTTLNIENEVHLIGDGMPVITNNASSPRINAGAISTSIKGVNFAGNLYVYAEGTILNNIIVGGTTKILNNKITIQNSKSVTITSEGSNVSNCIITDNEASAINVIGTKNVINNNIIKDVPTYARPPISFIEKMLGCKFGRIVQENGTQKNVNPTPNSFEIFVNESSNMTLKMYGYEGTVQAQLTADVFILITGGYGDDVQEPSYQKTFILYTGKGTLGITSLNKWITISAVNNVSNKTKVEITCPANTYHGIISNKDRKIEI